MAHSGDRPGTALGDVRQRGSLRGFNIDKSGRGDAFLASPRRADADDAVPTEKLGD